MNTSRVIAAVLLSTSVAVSPAFADNRDRGHNDHQGREAHRSAGPRNEARAEAPRQRGTYQTAPSRAVPVQAPRVYDRHNAYQYHSVAPRVVVHPHGVAPARYYRPYYAPAHFYRPYYTFRPHLNLGFGLWLGYPVVYSAPYYSPYYDPYGPYGAPYPAPAYPYPPAPYPQQAPYPQAPYPPASPQAYPQGYPGAGAPPSNYPAGTSGTVGVQANMGGLSFEMSPSNAEVFLDGNFVGTVDEFSPQSQPLGAVAGQHRVEIRADGFRTMTFDVNIIAGQVLPYRGAMNTN